MDHTYFPVSRFVSSVKETARYAIDAREEIGERASLALPYGIVSIDTALYCDLLYYTMLYRAISFYIMSQCIILYNIIP